MSAAPARATPTAAHAGAHEHGTHVGPAAGAAAPTRHTGPQGNVGQFVTDCAYSHTAPDDPIVHPARPGYSHEHDFFGNTSTDADSDLASLLGGDTTCQMKLDTAAYWAPRLLRAGQPVTPSKSSAYYRAAPGVDPTAVEAFPPGLMIVAGDMTADADAPQDPDLAGWTCGTSTDARRPRRRRARPRHPCAPSSPSPTAGTAATSTARTTGRTWPTAARASARTPIPCTSRSSPSPSPIPSRATRASLTLASGAVYGIHADFVNAWDQDGLVNEIESCLHRGVVCGLSSNRGEEPLFGG